MPQLLGAITGGIVDAGVVSPPTNLSAAKLGLKELVDFGEIGIVYPNSPLATIATVLGKKSQHGFAAVARLLRRHSSGQNGQRGNDEGARQDTRKFKDPEILGELYRIYGVKYLEPIPKVRLDARRRSAALRGENGGRRQGE